jgi:nitrate reductase (NAD(P)H)
MMNNSRYRVKPRFELQGDQHDHPSIVLDHPVAPGAREGGWMKLGADEAAKLAAEEAKSDDGKELTTEEIAKHATKDDCWIVRRLDHLPWRSLDVAQVINGKVYDVTSTLSWHPGGANAILAVRPISRPRVAGLTQTAARR